MSEHYTKNTVSANVWCNKCGKSTDHRVDNGRRGPCIPCMAKLKAPTQMIDRTPRQKELF